MTTISPFRSSALARPAPSFGSPPAPASTSAPARPSSPSAAPRASTSPGVQPYKMLWLRRDETSVDSDASRVMSALAKESGVTEAQEPQGAGPVQEQIDGQDVAAPVAAGEPAPGTEPSPAEPPVLANYLSAPRADQTAPPALLEGLEYGSFPAGPNVLITEGNDKEYIVGAVGTPPEVGQLAEAGLGNLFIEPWRQQVADAVARNGGLGTTGDGFLAFSRDMGFVRLRHPGLTPEQNRRLATISLQTGWPIERLPCRQMKDGYTDPEFGQWVDDFIGKYETQFGAFVGGQSEQIEIKDGSRNRYVMKKDPEVGAVVSYQYRKAGGFKGWAQKNMKIVGPVLDALSVVGGAVLGPEVSLALQGIKQGLVTVATGKFTVQQGAALVAAGLPVAGVTGTAAGVIKGGLALGVDLADDGKLSAAGVLGVLSPALDQLPLDATSIEIIKQSAKVVGGLVEGRNPTLADVWNVLSPALLGVGEPATRDAAIDAVSSAIDSGAVPASEFGGLLASYLESMTSDPALRETFRRGIDVAVSSIIDRKISAADLLRAVVPFIEGVRDERRAFEFIKNGLGAKAA